LLRVHVNSDTLPSEWLTLVMSFYRDPIDGSFMGLVLASPHRRTLLGELLCRVGAVMFLRYFQPGELTDTFYLRHLARIAYRDGLPWNPAYYPVMPAVFRGGVLTLLLITRKYRRYVCRPVERLIVELLWN
jgi:hypothetical protein